MYTFIIPSIVLVVAVWVTKFYYKKYDEGSKAFEGVTYSQKTFVEAKLKMYYDIHIKFLIIGALAIAALLVNAILSTT